MNCQAHSKQLQFVCETEFTPLCSSCIPQHSKLHESAKSSMLICSALQFRQQATGQVTAMLERISKKQMELNNVLNADRLYSDLGLERLKQELIKHIEVVFEEVKNQFFRLRDLSIEECEDVLSQVQNEMERNHHALHQFAVGQSIQGSIAFKKKQGEYDKIVQEMQAKTDTLLGRELKCPFREPAINQLKRSLTSLIFSSIQAQEAQKLHTQQQRIHEKPQSPSINQGDIQEKEAVKEKQSRVSKLSTTRKKQAKKKRCNDCGSQLQYLTDLKKHLVCRSCGNKQRNYGKRV